ncbi:KilA-N domain-containing protein [Klebsiella pneumoniae]|uniref:KilA-N domain-containing protein n=1 Tax=Pseudomonas aeruginosa TaxID=287 RepID=UPI0020A4C06D|nr:KilA-N domain-containing protein [Klebsiella pneumoniae]MDW1553960.1 KilA-N domain-containing protein [Klebsiella pneumoniae]MDW5808039.1 KilA-N domain-containing protein [Klebsiella pneumoniae]GKI97879.1 hypothetical protein NUBL6723_01200 [Klebsiella pneumoniae]GKJ21277.1 hypothetical protein NUBL7079_04180 [Klebsiella pneumoniae]GKK75076.1 hypothetical protein NUBL13796_07370 [Klebsiella pneumoniae]
MSNIIPMNYDDRSFPFTADCWFNATVAAKHHGKLPKDWLKTEATKIYIAELAEELGIASSGVKEDFSPLLVRVEKRAKRRDLASSGVGGGIRPLVVSKIRPRL